jgi:hypothetical protein
MKKKPKINFVIDALMFLLMVAMGGIGFLMKYTLIPGSERWKLYERNVELYLFGMDRHEWGTVHLILGFIFFGLLVLHIIMHWKLITIYFRLFISSSKIRLLLGSVFAVISIVLLLFAFFVPFEVALLRQGEGHQRMERAIEEPTEIRIQESEKSEQKSHKNEEVHERHTRSEKSQIDIRGDMTLKQAAVKYDVPADSIKKYLEIPVSVSENEKLGRLRRRYDFHMSDVERFIEEYHHRKK